MERLRGPPVPRAPPKKPEGPQGANLFVNFLPKSYTDEKLWELFQRFGPIISTTVYIDTVTNQSKCFGRCLYSLDLYLLTPTRFCEL